MRTKSVDWTIALKQWTKIDANRRVGKWHKTKMPIKCRRKLTRWSISNAYSNPDVKLATFSHFIALTASFISFTLSTLARTYGTQTNRSKKKNTKIERITTINIFVYTLNVFGAHIVECSDDRKLPFCPWNMAPPIELYRKMQSNWRNRYRWACQVWRSPFLWPIQKICPTLIRMHQVESSDASDIANEIDNLWKLHWICVDWFGTVFRITYNVLGRWSRLNEPVFYPKIVDRLIICCARMRPLCARKSTQKSGAGAKVLPRECSITFQIVGKYRIQVLRPCDRGPNLGLCATKKKKMITKCTLKNMNWGLPVTSTPAGVSIELCVKLTTRFSKRRIGRGGKSFASSER